MQYRTDTDCAYDATKTHLTTIKTTVTSENWFSYGDDRNINYFTINNSRANTAYMRSCCSYIGDDSVVTVNETIV